MVEGQIRSVGVLGGEHGRQMQLTICPTRSSPQVEGRRSFEQWHQVLQDTIFQSVAVDKPAHVSHTGFAVKTFELQAIGQ